jgi:TolA-binding protein
MHHRLALLALMILSSVPVALAQPGTSPADAVYADAFALFDAGLYGEAARAFEAFRARYPDHPRYPDALFYGGQAELAAGSDARAAALLRTFHTRYPAHPLASRARLALGEYYFLQGDDNRAIAALREALTENQPADDAARALLMIGQAELRQGRVDAAVTELQRVHTLYPRSDAAPKALYAIGYAESEREDWAAAADAFGRLATRYRRTPEDRAVGLAYAEALLRSGQLSEAAAEAERRLAEIPDSSVEGGLPLSPAVAAERRARRDRALFIAAEAYLRQGDRERAEDRFSQIDPDGLYGRRAAFGLGRIAMDRRQWQEAAGLYARASGPEPGARDALGAEAYYYGGIALTRLGRLDDAERRFAAVATGQPDSPMADLALFEQGLLLYTTRRWDEATAAFERLLDRYPTSTHAGEAARMLGETYAALGDFQGAARATARAQQLGTASPELQGEVEFQRGYDAMQRGDYTDAERDLMRVYERAPRGERAGEALFWAAEAAFQRAQQGDRGGLDRAISRFDTFLRDFPEHRQRDAAQYARAWALFRRGNYDAAATAFERFLAGYRPAAELVPYTADARLRLADSYFALRRWDAAIAAYQRIEGPAGADYALFQIAQAHGNAGRLAEAEAYYSRLLTDFPQSPLRPQARYGIGDLHFQRTNYDRAVTVFEEVMTQHPGSPIAAKAQFAIGDARYNQGRLNEAAAAYRLVIERYPRSPLVPDALAAAEMTLSVLGREDEVTRLVDTYAAQNPGAGAGAVDELRFRQAEGRFQRGDLRGAVSDFQDLLQRARDPELRPPILLYLGRAHASLGEAPQAETYYRRLIEQHPASPLSTEAARRLGQLYLQQRRWAEALPLFQQARSRAETGTDGAEARLGEATALIGLGRHAEAEPLLQAVIADAPTAATTARARLRLAELYDASNRSRQASELYEQVARGDEGAIGAEAASRLATSLLARGDAQGVIDATDRLRIEERFAGYPERVAETLLTRARAFRRLGQTGRAQETFDRVIRAYSDTPAAAVARRERDA